MQTSSAHPTTPTRVVVLGGTGKTGRRVAATLQASRVEVLTAARRGDRIFDWESPDTWDGLWDGADAAYLVDSQLPDAADQMAAVLAGARKAGLRRAVLLSARAWAPTPGEAQTTAALSPTEAAVMAAVDEWTVLRPTWFVQNLWEEPLFRDTLESGELVLPLGDGREPLIDAWDIAEVATTCLLSDGHAGCAYALSGPELTTFAEAANIMVNTGRVRSTVTAVKEEEYRRHLEERGFAPDHVDLAVTLLGELVAGAGAYLSPGVEMVTGRQPRSVRDVIDADAPRLVSDAPAARG
jgi:uncharacterized protein YbjT (DUF2867 family)